ncbi:hypothetical protein H0I76_14450 [Limibaculum sp. M0105]|uniref:Uncharacterized protein n=1 Tax=Thermohalobaculum xanthum TaxID=2753746 RepID=A0A8J7M9X2_9RHOB|nr:hypothetical protein [Thermohalobaculum xanthum]MBK0400398.1 hypothetical protein [Thermohalobaculum xanthum]
MQIENRALVLDLVAWLAPAPRPYDEVMAAWRTSCPRLTVWEDALDLGLVARRPADGTVAATEAGRALLRAEGRCA